MMKNNQAANRLSESHNRPPGLLTGKTMLTSTTTKGQKKRSISIDRGMGYKQPTSA